MAALVDIETRNGRTSSRPAPSSSSTMASSSHKKPRKAIIESDPEDEEPAVFRDHGSSSIYSMDTDISQLEAPTFTTLDRGPSKTMLQLKWDHTVNLIGKKVVNPMIHCCDICLRPILIYGRLIPCKHVFCLSCASTKPNSCSRCKDKVTRVEPVGLGSIYMCSHGGSRYGNNGCRRTYLSLRDLQAHIQHRHIKNSTQQQTPVVVPERKDSRPAEGRTTSVSHHETSAPKDIFRVGSANTAAYSIPQASYSQPVVPPPPPATQHHISVISSTRQSNLITVPIHDNSGRDMGVPPPPVGVPGYPYSHPAPVAGGPNFSQPPPTAASTQHYYPPAQAAGYPESSGQSSYPQQWRTGSSSYYRR